MLLFIVILSLVIDSQADCAAAPGYRAGRTTIDSIRFGGLTRSWRVYVPPTYNQNQPAPVILVFHGGLSSPSNAQNKYKFDDLADTNNFIVVYPAGYTQFWNAGPHCCGIPAQKGTDDVGFVSALIEVLKQKLCIDPQRVFATGMSAGGAFAYTLGCQLSDKISGIAVVEGSLMAATCTPTRPISTLVIHGTNDKHIPFMGGPGCGGAIANWTSVPASLDHFLTSNGCQCAYGAASCSTNVTLEDTICTNYGTCGHSSTGTLCVVQQKGHAWPGTASGWFPGCDMTAGKWKATDYITNFFLSIHYT